MGCPLIVIELGQSKLPYMNFRTERITVAVDEQDAVRGVFSQVCVVNEHSSTHVLSL